LQLRQERSGAEPVIWLGAEQARQQFQLPQFDAVRCEFALEVGL